MPLANFFATKAPRHKVTQRESITEFILNELWCHCDLVALFIISADRVLALPGICLLFQGVFSG